MKTSKIIWGIMGTVAVISTLLFIVGFAYASNQILFPKKTAIAEPVSTPVVNKDKVTEAKDKLQIVALGDSLTAGTGDLAGKGYVGRVKEKLETQMGKPVFVINNFAVPGYTTTQLLADVKKQQTQSAMKEADIILFTIGGNDLFEGGEGLFTGEGQDEFNPQAAVVRIAPAIDRVEQIITEVNKVNPDAVVLYVGLYHPYLDMDPKKEGSLIVQKWNDSVFAIMNRYPNMIVVPTYDLFERNLMKYLFTDHFHPNQDGYERIADRIAQIMK
ncbi:Spore germination lipase LipC [compost metagenome]